MTETRPTMIDSIRAWLNSNKLKKQEKTELVAMIEDLQNKLKVQIQKAAASLEELDQAKLYYLFADTTNQTELIRIRDLLRHARQFMRWTSPNILIINRPLIDLSETDLEQLMLRLKQLKRGVK